MLQRIPEETSMITERVSRLREEGRPIVIAIDGRCTSGKTTYAGILSELLDVPVFHMDDFFLQVHQRTPERYAEPGGNVDRERLIEEVLEPFREGSTVISHRRFIRGIMALSEPVSTEVKDCIILEGSYSCHPLLQKYSDLKIFMDIDPEEQLKRVLARDGISKYDEFKEKWIPLEENYFNAYDIRSICDIIIHNG
ncbi:MAG: hypothetical protein Q4D24_09105 [Erysipelotrichaceae bacterium]|nr:hypothetical protein [Erysipelotrichaceae bacterium]